MAYESDEEKLKKIENERPLLYFASGLCAFTFLSFLILFFAGIFNGYHLFAGLLLGFVGWWVWKDHLNRYREQEEKIYKKQREKELYQYASYYRQVLTVKKRGYTLSDLISIEEDHTVSTAYKPEQINVGAVSVGSVVSGGVYKTGGYRYFTGDKKNGLYRMKYNGQFVSEIELCPNVYEQAKNSEIAKYLSGNIIKVVDASFTQSEHDLMMRCLRSGIDAPEHLAKRGYPSYEKCSEIKRWLTSNQ